mmetsp:Transcript_15586/g.65710  ORF Transcript_15586/g.65710 Transcript_15586/m.65710 type:complete len:299 (+) Transcript_15586:442-1338(+)
MPLKVRRPRGSARVLPVLDAVGFSDLRAGEGGVRDSGGGPGREAGRDKPRSIADGVRRDVARLGPRGGARRHFGEDRGGESRDIQASRPRVHLTADRRGDGGVTETRGRARRRPTDGSAAAFVRQGRVLSQLRGRNRARARRRAPEAKRRARRAARSRVGVQGEARVGPRGGVFARRGRAPGDLPFGARQDGVVGKSAGRAGPRERERRRERRRRRDGGRVHETRENVGKRGGRLWVRVARVVPGRRAHGGVHGAVRGVVLRRDDRGMERERKSGRDGEGVRDADGRRRGGGSFAGGE